MKESIKYNLLKMICPKISVIVAVYNVEKYLRRCLDSIKKQTFCDYELILINDGSSDASLKICQEYVKQDSRIKLFDNKNQGISFTRDFGVQKASGEYILFVDSDDWIEPDMLEIMYNAAIMNDADIVGCSFYMVTNNKTQQISCVYNSKEQFLRDVLQNYWGTVWKILTKRTVYNENNIHFPLGVNGGEDYVVCVQLLYYAQRAFSIDKPLYNYFRGNSSSITYNVSIKKIFEQIKAVPLNRTAKQFFC